MNLGRVTYALVSRERWKMEKETLKILCVILCKVFPKNTKNKWNGHNKIKAGDPCFSDHRLSNSSHDWVYVQ